MLQDPINNSALALKGYPVKIFAYYYYCYYYYCYYYHYYYYTIHCISHKRLKK